MKTILSVAIGAMLVLSAIEIGAQTKAAERKVELAIEQQTLADALNEWAKQTGLQLVSASSKGMNTTVAPVIKGEYTAQGALDELLKGTTLTYEWVSERAVAIREKPLVVPAAWQSSGADQSIRLAFLDTASDVIDRNQQSSTTGQGKPDSLSDSTDVDPLDEVIVTGSRLRRPVGEGPARVVTLDRKRIEQLGVTNVADALSYIPEQTFEFNEQSNAVGARVVRLRGLGIGTTLVLINGRRTVTSALLGSSNAYDLNTIPLAAVDRIEVLSGSASAIYGADAVGGVINVVLKSAIDEPRVDLFYGAADSGADERRASFAIGGESSRLKTALVLDYFDRSFLHGQDRALYADQDFRRFGSTDRRSTFSNPGNISSLTTANLPGLPSPIAAVPSGSSGIGLTPADFLATAGQTNLESLNGFQSVVPKTERITATATADLALTDQTTLFSELLYAQRDDETLLTPSILFATVPATNPYNPFGVPVRARYLFTAAGTQRRVSAAESFRAVAGLEGHAGRWEWEVSALSTDENGDSKTLNAIDTVLANAALASTDPARALNVFQDGPGGSPQLIESLKATPLVNNDSSKALQGAAFVRGPLFSLPAGDAQFALGLEARKEKLHFEVKPVLALTEERKSQSAYAELGIPLLGGDLSFPLLSALRATLAGRHDHYDDFGDTFNPQYGLEWQPIKGVLLRAAYGTSFRPPSLFELYQPQTAFPSLIADTRRGELAPYTSRIGGNPDLDPEESRSVAAGLVLTPDTSIGLQADVTYWQIEQLERVQALSDAAILANEARFADRVVRQAPTPADVAAGRPGRLVSINSTNLNFGALDTSGIDFGISFAFDTRFGRLAPSLAATWVDSFEASNVPNTPAVERVGVANLNGTILRWRGTATLAWSKSGLSLAAAARYRDAYADAAATGIRNGRTVSSQTLVDLQAAVSMGELFDAASSWTDGITIRAGVINVFDEEPNFSEISGAGFDFSQVDTRQRFGYVSVSKSF